MSAGSADVIMRTRASGTGSFAGSLVRRKHKPGTSELLACGERVAFQGTQVRSVSALSGHVRCRGGVPASERRRLCRDRSCNVRSAGRCLRTRASKPWNTPQESGLPRPPGPWGWCARIFVAPSEAPSASPPLNFAIGLHVLNCIETVQAKITTKS